MTKNDPFGGVKGDEVKQFNPFAADKKVALSELIVSIDWLEGRKRKSDKSILERMRDGSWGQEEKIPNWEPSADTEFEGVDVILRWAGKEVTRVRNVNKQEAKVALSGLKAFLNRIDPGKPDFSNSWVVKCYNITAKIYNLDHAIEIESDIEDAHPHLFAGIQGDKSAFSQNRFEKDIKRAIRLTDVTLSFLEVAELPLRKRPPELRISKTKLCTPTYRTSTSHFDVSLMFANQNILTEKNIPLTRARIAISSMRGWLRAIDSDRPDFNDEIIKKCYEATKLRTRPGRYGKIEKELLPMDEGGSSFWSDKSHCWITGHFNSSGDFVGPDWTK